MIMVEPIPIHIISFLEGKQLKDKQDRAEKEKEKS